MPSVATLGAAILSGIILSSANAANFSTDQHASESFLDISIYLGRPGGASNLVADLGRFPLQGSFVGVANLDSDLDGSFALAGDITTPDIVDRRMDLFAIGSVDLSLVDLNINMSADNLFVDDRNFFFEVDPTRQLVLNGGMIEIDNPQGLIATLLPGEFPVITDLNANPLPVPDYLWGYAGTRIPGTADVDEFNIWIPSVAFIVEELGPGVTLYVQIEGEIHAAVPELNPLGIMTLALGAGLTSRQLLKIRSMITW